MVKNPPAMLETRAPSMGPEDPLEKGMATHSSTLAWRTPWQYKTISILLIYILLSIEFYKCQLSEVLIVLFKVSAGYTCHQGKRQWEVIWVSLNSCKLQLVLMALFFQSFFCLYFVLASFYCYIFRSTNLQYLLLILFTVFFHFILFCL